MSVIFPDLEGQMQWKINQWSEELGVEFYMFIRNMKFMKGGKFAESGQVQTIKIILNGFMHALHIYRNSVTPPDFPWEKRISTTEIAT